MANEVQSSVPMVQTMRMRASVRASFRMLAVALYLVIPLHPVAHAAADPDTQAWPLRLRHNLDRLGNLEWRLRAAAGSACPTTVADIGVTFDDRRAYPSDTWHLLAATVEMADKPVVAAVASDGPAAKGGIKPGDTVQSLGGLTVGDILANGQAGLPPADVLADFVAQHVPGKDLSLELLRGDIALTFTITPTRHCGARFILTTDNAIEAHSDGHNIAISTGTLRFAINDDELALVAGHELGHVIARDGKAKGLEARRAMEDAADALGATLVRCAGYDLIRASAFFDRFAQRDWGGFLRPPTHRGARVRAARIRATVADPSCQIRTSAQPANGA